MNGYGKHYIKFDCHRFDFFLTATPPKIQNASNVEVGNALRNTEISDS